MTCWTLRITQGKIELRPNLPDLSHILADAVEAIRRFPPEVAWMDIGLPVRDSSH